MTFLDYSLNRSFDRIAQYCQKCKTCNECKIKNACDRLFKVSPENWGKVMDDKEDA